MGSSYTADSDSSLSLLYSKGLSELSFFRVVSLKQSGRISFLRPLFRQVDIIRLALSQGRASLVFEESLLGLVGYLGFQGWLFSPTENAILRDFLTEEFRRFCSSDYLVLEISGQFPTVEHLEQVSPIDFLFSVYFIGIGIFLINQYFGHSQTITLQLQFESFLVHNTQIDILPIGPKREQPQNIDKHSIPLKYIHKPIILILPSSILQNEAHRRIDPHPRQIQTRNLLKPPTLKRDKISTPMPHPLHHERHPHRQRVQNHKEYDRTGPMQLPRTLRINRPDRHRKTQNRELTQRVHPGRELFGEAYPGDLVVQPLEDAEEDQGQEGRGGEHAEPEEDVLGVGAGSAGDCCEGVDRDVVFGGGDVVCDAGGYEEDWDLDPEEQVEADAAGFAGVGGWDGDRLGDLCLHLWLQPNLQWDQNTSFIFGITTGWRQDQWARFGYLCYVNLLKIFFQKYIISHTCSISLQALLPSISVLNEKFTSKGLPP